MNKLSSDFKIYDVTLRDGNHALRHKIDLDFIKDYCSIAESSGMYAVEVGHGNGLGASSFLVGKNIYTDQQMINVARENLNQTKLAIHSIPGFSTIERDLKPAIDSGVDVFRVASHVTEATVTEKHIKFLADLGIEVNGVLMMSHMIDISGLVKQVELMHSFGASAVVLMDSAGYFRQNDIIERVNAIKSNLSIDLGFHAHNNLGLGVVNAVTALENGVKIIDGASMGLGAGAGNAQLEVIVANLKRDNYFHGELKGFLDLGSLVEEKKRDFLPKISTSSILSGLNGVFSGYAPQVEQLSREYELESEYLWQELGKRKLVAGQESIIREIAQDLRNL